jgi:uncharacterized RDD family membrane protein YckC
MGTVFEAEESHFGRKVALKLVSPEIVASGEAVERFKLEGRLASAIAHPRCVFVLNADQENGRPFIVMELMQGSTLADLVQKQGPLHQADAIRKILDVIEGLREAHRLGLIHRDVKPSNCFLDDSGRVKIGDFGLSKSLVRSSELTRTGSFLGTPLYASPEQIRGETLDPRSDLYAVAATLYFLLAGRAPFQGGDAAATLARIVSDPPPPLRTFRPDIPPALERVIMKGLERNRDKRFRDLAEFQEALSAFLPARLSAAGLSFRAAAYILDVPIAKIALFSLLELVILLLARKHNLDPASALRLNVLLDALLFAFCFLLVEPRTGASPAKWLFRLRVRQEDQSPAPALSILKRNLIFYLITTLPWSLYILTISFLNTSIWFPLLSTPIRLACLIPVLWPMRATTGYRGLHDLLSHTCVLALPRTQQRLAPAQARRRIGRDRGIARRPVGVLDSVGPYRIRGAVRWEPTRKVLAAEDSTLGREAWIVLRPRSAPPPNVARRELSRPTRPRWLSGGDQPEGRWDAFVAPAGCPLADLAGPGGLPWREVRPILEDLADETAAAAVDGTLPHGATLDLVWVEPDGRTQIVDPLAMDDSPAHPPAAGAPPAMASHSNPFDILRAAAAIALEGGLRRSGDLTTPIRAPVPLHARAILDQLMARDHAGYAQIEDLRRDLRQTSHLPTFVPRINHAIRLIIQALLLLLPTALIAYLSLAFASSDPAFLPARVRDRLPAFLLKPAGGALLILLILALLLAWSAWTRGGLSLRALKLALVNSAGRTPSAARTLLRSLLHWIPPISCWLLAIAVHAAVPAVSFLPYIPFALGCLALLIPVIPLFLEPEKSPYDRISGTTLVPY